MKHLLLFSLFSLCVITAFAQRPEQHWDNNKLGYKWDDGRVVVQPMFDNGGYFTGGLCYVVKNEKWALINTEGKILTPFKYDYIDIYEKHGGTIRVMEGKKHGLIDPAGKEIVPCIYDELTGFVHNRARVQLNSKYGYIDRTGAVVVPIIYEELEDETNTYSKGWNGLVMVNSKYGMLDTATLKELVSPQYEFIGSFVDGLAVAGKDGKQGVIDKKGKTVIPFEYEQIETFSEGLALAMKNGKRGFINSSNEVVIPFIYEEAAPVYNGFIEVKMNGKTAFIDKENKQTGLPENVKRMPKDHNVYEGKLREGLKAVKRCEYQVDSYSGYYDYKNCYYAFIDEKNNVVFTIPDSLVVPESNEAVMQQGFALVTRNDKYGYIDKQGKPVIPCVFSRAGAFSEGLAFAAKLDSAYEVGYIGTDGRFVFTLPASYNKNYGGCYYHGLPFSNGKAKMQLSENGSDCDRSDSIFVDKKGTITKQ